VQVQMLVQCAPRLPQKHNTSDKHPAPCTHHPIPFSEGDRILNVPLQNRADATLRLPHATAALLTRPPLLLVSATAATALSSAKQVLADCLLCNADRGVRSGEVWRRWLTAAVYLCCGNAMPTTSLCCCCSLAPGLPEHTAARCCKGCTSSPAVLRLLPQQLLLLQLLHLRVCCPYSPCARNCCF